MRGNSCLIPSINLSNSMTISLNIDFSKRDKKESMKAALIIVDRAGANHLA